MKPQVSLYIPAFNVAQHITRCVEGVFAQTLLPAEILIIDDGSTDATAAIARELVSNSADHRTRPTVKLVQHARNQGLAAARNTALRESACELVASLDADTCPDPEWLARLVAHLDHPNVAISSGTLIESAIHSPADRWRRNFMTQSWGNQLRHNPRFVYGNNVLLRKSIAIEVGGYDPAMRTNGEDMDLSEKVRSAGFDTVYDPAAIVRHYRTDDRDSILRTQWNWHYYGLKFNLARPSLMQLGIYNSYFFGVSMWRILKPRRDWLDSGQFDINLRFPFYMSRKLLAEYRGKVGASA